MRQFIISFADRDTLPDSIEQVAADLGVTPEQLIKRFIIKGMTISDPDQVTAVPGHTLDDFLVKNKLLKPDPNDKAEYRPFNDKSDDI